MIESYPSIYATGHRAVADLFASPVLVEEKIDGSQFSMRRDADGTLHCRSKGQALIPDAPEKMFAAAVETAHKLDLHPGWTYRCEYLRAPKHNTLAYNRIPKQHLIVFDVSTGLETYLAPSEKRAECDRLGIECVPALYEGIVSNFDQITAFLDLESCLGGPKIEGVVIKNYTLFTAEKKVAMAKFVSEAFKEKHKASWKVKNPTSRDVVAGITLALRTEARWRKAVQHLRDAGQLTESPKDIGNLIKEIQADIRKEEMETISQSLLKYALPHILRGVVGGFPEWYKTYLAEQAFAPIAAIEESEEEKVS